MRRATELEARPALPGGTDPPGGLTLTELQDVAREAGIDPVAVRRAALARLPTPPRSLATVLRGGPAVREHTIRLPGRLPSGRHEELARALDRVMRADGAVTTGGRRSGDRSEGSATAQDPASPHDPGAAFLWEEDHTQGRTRVSVEPEPTGHSSVTVHADRRGWAAALNLVGLVAGVGAGALAFPATGSAVAAVAAALVVWRGLVRVVWGPYAHRLERRLESGVAEVAGHLDHPHHQEDADRGEATDGR